jgi:DNA-binding transcriptional ArsR family regulator
LFHLLGEPTRLRLLLLLAERGEAPVGALVEAAGQPQSTVSGHLGLLRRCGVVTCRREGKHCHYRLNSPFAANLLRAVRKAGGRVPRPQRRFRRTRCRASASDLSFLKGSSGVEPVPGVAVPDAWAGPSGG